jgi:hypothetical protein
LQKTSKTLHLRAFWEFFKAGQASESSQNATGGIDYTDIHKITSQAIAFTVSNAHTAHIKIDHPAQRRIQAVSGRTRACAAQTLRQNAGVDITFE